ncbi:NAD/GMP synthase [Trypanosoma melophagium]|uniref:NAD/GMP synthase n=1 Tax=Trypanosoma melophagium TaxID=715481 RepID=UPI00351A38A5|nr:NAD/GMP synthase [Trypanosoma melophagium]
MTSAPTLHKELQAKLAEYRRKRGFDPALWIESKCAKLNEYMMKSGLKVCVTSVSGGIDSAVVLALCSHAQRMPNSPIVKNIGLCQPICSSAWALERGRENIQACGAVEIIVDQTTLHAELSKTIEKAVGINGKDFARGQLRSYMRTPTAYYVAQLYSQEGTSAIVMGTGNMDEDGYLGYFCKAGDGVVDVQLISDLHKSEVFQVAKELGVPANTIHAPPSADLWQGQTDEEELGFPYDFVELYTGWYVSIGKDEQQAFLHSISAEARKQFEAYVVACENVHRRNAHKLKGVINI